MLKILIFSIFVLNSIANNFLFSQEVGDEYFQNELHRLNFLNLQAFNRLDVILWENEELDSNKTYSESDNLKALKDNLVSCNEKCFETIIKSKEEPIELSLKGQEVGIETIYSSSDFKTPIGNIVMLGQVFFVFNNEVHFLKSINNSYGYMSDQLNLSPSSVSGKLK